MIVYRLLDWNLNVWNVAIAYAISRILVWIIISFYWQSITKEYSKTLNIKLLFRSSLPYCWCLISQPQLFQLMQIQL